MTTTKENGQAGFSKQNKQEHFSLKDQWLLLLCSPSSSPTPLPPSAPLCPWWLCMAWGGGGGGALSVPSHLHQLP